MSPAAVALAVLLHAMVALALWWVAQEPKAPAEPALEVYFERAPKPEEKPPEPEQRPEQKPEPPKPEPQPQPQPPPPQVMPPIEALAPPAEIVSDKPTQAPPKGDKPKDAELAPPPPPLQDVLPSPDQDLVPPPAAELAKIEPAPTPPPPTPPAPPVPAPPVPAPPAVPPTPSLQSILPSPGEDLPAPSAADFAKVEPAPKPPTPAPQQKTPPAPQQQALAKPPEKPQQQQQAKPPMPQLQKPEYKPSPLSTAPSRRPPAGTQSENPSPSPFVNPADTYNKARAADNYLWQVVRRLQGYRYTANVSATQGITVVRVVIARDGRLLNVTVSRSSGVPEFDQGVLAGVRSGSPYAPLPPDIRGDSATFDLPLVSTRR